MRATILVLTTALAALFGTGGGAWAQAVTVFSHPVPEDGRSEPREARIITATLPAGAAGGWHSHPYPIYVYLAEGQVALEVEGGIREEYRAGQGFFEPANKAMRTVNLLSDIPAKFIAFQISPPAVAFTEPAQAPSKP